eukprot:scaffold16829_cov69-Phaeocystis_antarctica.AAC.4
MARVLHTNLPKETTALPALACIASLACAATAHPAPPAYPLRRQPILCACQPILSAPPAYPLVAASLSSAPPADTLHRQPILGGRFENCRSVPLPVLIHPSHTSQ